MIETDDPISRDPEHTGRAAGRGTLSLRRRPTRSNVDGAAPDNAALSPQHRPVVSRRRPRPVFSAEDIVACSDLGSDGRVVPAHRPRGGARGE